MTTTLLTDARAMCFVATTRPDEARTFYSDTLGLTFIAEDGFALHFTIHKTLMLRVQKVAELKPQPFTVAGWQVEDIEATLADLSNHGVKFEHYDLPFQDALGIASFPNGDKVAWFKDPDDNILSLAQIAS